MHEHLNQPEQDTTKTAGSVNSQDLAAAYEETHVPYLPSPDVDLPQAKSDDVQEVSQPADTTETQASIPGGIILLGAILGAILGGAFSFVTKGNLVQGVGIGVVVGAVLAISLPMLLSEGMDSWVLLEGLGAALGEMSSCCHVAALLIAVSSLAIGGLLFSQTLLLVALMGASIMVIVLIALSLVLVKHRNYHTPQRRGQPVSTIAAT